MKTYNFNHKLIKSRREFLGLTQTEIGVRLYQEGAAKRPVTYQQVQLWETGRVRPNSPSLVGLARILGVPAESFYIVEESQESEEEPRSGNAVA